MNKRGLSDVVTTVLIILLVVAAVSAVWAFVSPLITKQNMNAQLCLSNSVEVLSCQRVNLSSSTGYNIAYKTTFSDDSIEGLTQAKISLEFEDGSFGTLRGLGLLNNGEIFTASAQTPKIVKKVRISGEFALKDNSKILCESYYLECSSSNIINTTEIGYPLGSTFNQSSIQNQASIIPTGSGTQ